MTFTFKLTSLHVPEAVGLDTLTCSDNQPTHEITQPRIEGTVLLNHFCHNYLTEGRYISCCFMFTFTAYTEKRASLIMKIILKN